MRPDPIVKVKHSSKQAPAASAGAISKHFDWADITFDAGKGIVLLRQKWKYTWQANLSSFARWTPAEKRSFHSKAEEQIWSLWNRKAVAQMRVEAAAPQLSRDLVEKCRGRWPEIVFDVQWVTEAPHWSVTVEKRAREMQYDPSQKRSRLMLPRAHVNWDTRTANFYQSSLAPGLARNPVTREPFNTKFNTPAHEFGHFLQNRDEYEDDLSPPDLNSLMYIGEKLRSRHFDAIKKALSEMLPGCVFTIVVK